jgi:predicted tellurium resistance membrane protein TerC
LLFSPSRRKADRIRRRDVSGSAQSIRIRERECGGIWQALWIIIMADTSMGIDNMPAVGVASKGSLFLLLFGLALSISIPEQAKIVSNGA